MKALIDFGIAVIEGEPVANRAYSGFPLLHYTGPEKTGVVVPKLDGRGNVVGGNLDVHQIWYGQHIESDITFVDLTPILYDGAGDRLKDADGNDLNVTWTVTYTVDVLSRGHDDFSPFVIYFDPFASGDVKKPKKAPHIGMDQTFFPMDDGTRTVFKIKMAPAIYQNFIYTWGWRNHPPRIQVIESATAPVDYDGKPHPECPDAYQGMTSPEIDRSVFCPPDDPDCTSVRCAGGAASLADGEPTPCERRKLYAIGRIGELSPAKRMWRALREARDAASADDYRQVARIVRDAGVPAFHDWQDRTTLPAGVEVDPEADLTLLYVNNTIYGQLTDGAMVRWSVWQERPQTLRVTAYNGDTFPHGLQHRRLRRQPRLGESVQVVGQGRRLGLLVHLRAGPLVGGGGGAERLPLRPRGRDGGARQAPLRSHLQLRSVAASALLPVRPLPPRRGDLLPALAAARGRGEAWRGFSTDGGGAG